MGWDVIIGTPGRIWEMRKNSYMSIEEKGATNSKSLTALFMNGHAPRRCLSACIIVQQGFYQHAASKTMHR